MSGKDLRPFPASKIEALTMLYLQNQDLSELTPEELLDKYQDTYEKLQAYKREQRNQDDS